MIPIIDFERRSLTGPAMSNDEFDDKLMDTAMELVEKYDLNFDLDDIIADDERADAVFNAAVEFLAEIGVFNRSTSRVIKWTEEEIKEMVREYQEAPRSFVAGAGKEAVTIEGRKAGDGKTPVIWAGGGPLFNDIFIEPSIKAFVKEPCVKGFLKAGALAKAGEIEARADHPSEIFVQAAETDLQIKALEKAGRQGMFLGNINSPNPASSALCVRPGRYEKTQCMMGVHIAPEQKIDNARLLNAMIAEDLGVTPWCSSMSMMGGLAGGPGGAAMCATANMLAQLSYSHGAWCNVAIADMKGSSKTKMTLACMSAVLRAAERHLGIPTGAPCCDSTVSTCFEEAIIAGTMIAVAATASGAAVNWLTGTTPLTARLQDDVMKNVSAMSREEADDIIKKMLALIEKVQKEHEGETCPFPQQLFFSVYDLGSLGPKPEYKAAIENAVAMMKEAGVPISEGFTLE